MTMVSLGDVITEARPGFAFGGDEPSGVLQLRMNNVTRDGRLNLTKRRRVSPEAHKRISDFFLQRGDVLFNATNSPEMVGKSLLVPELDEPTVYSNHFLRLRTESHRLDPCYLAHWLRQAFERGRFLAMCNKWVNQATVGRERLLGMTIPLPPLDEQRRIAETLDQADAIVELGRQALGHLEALSGSLFAQRFGDPVTNPRRLPERTLADWVQSDAPITYGILKPGPDVPAGVPYVRVVDIQSGGIRVEAVRRTTAEIADAYRRSRIAAGDLVISIRGHVGRLGVVPAALDGANITQDSARLRVPVPGREYVSAALSAPGLIRWMERRTKGAAVRGINLGDLRLAPIPLPPDEELRAFSAATARIRELVSLTTARIEAAEALGASLESQAFSGQL